MCSSKLPPPPAAATPGQYVRSTDTDIRKTFARLGWKPPERDWKKVREELNRPEGT